MLGALAGREPWRLAGAAVGRGRELGADPDAALRLGLLAETLAAALHTCDRAHGGRPLPTRLDRARRVLVADTLLTLCWELAADLPDAAFAAVAGELTTAAKEGLLAILEEGSRESPHPEAGASAFLDRTLPLLVPKPAARASRRSG